MRILTGTDIIEISRIKKSIEDLGESFINRIYTPEEIKYCESKKEAKYQHYAARFASKEAIFKAISELLNDKYDVSWNELEVLKRADGKPFVNIKQKEICDKIESIDISISHCKEYATANVTLLCK